MEFENDNDGGATAVMDEPAEVAAVPLAKRPLRELWVAFKLTGDTELRNELVVRHAHLVQFHAERILARLPREVELDDLVSVGTFGLIDAINGFDLDRGVKFTTYCAARIRGAILDELRAVDFAPRLVRTRSHAVDRATRELSGTLGRSPTAEELRKRLKVPKRQFEMYVRDATPLSVASLSRKWFETDSGRDVREVDLLVDPRVAAPSDEGEDRESRALVCKGLTRAEQMILTLYYWTDMRMKEVGRVLDLSESRISQMHDSIIARLRARFTEDELAELFGLGRPRAVA